MVLMAPVAAVRLCLIALWFSTSFAFLAPAMYKADPKKISKLRRYYIHKGWSLTSRGFLFLLGVWRIKHIGYRPSAECKGRKVVIVGNHSSFLDGWVISSFFSFPTTGVSKLSIKSVPLFGAALNALGFCWVDHINTGQGGSGKLAEHLADPNLPVMVMSPEGTTTNGECLLNFRKGAFVLQHPIQPIVIKYPSNFFAPMWTEVHPLLMFYRQLCSLYSPCEVHVLPVHDPTPSEKDNPQEFADCVRAEMALAGGLPLCNVYGHELLKADSSSDFGLDEKVLWQFKWS
eukprot:c12461_g1_i1.p1 GENE.c12461_g1_i1~~c12461_g1_i1.p1  ORF type:complete len:331 (+),score=42.22 c12461_g1_i1:130-993(+)